MSRHRNGKPIEMKTWITKTYTGDLSSHVSEQGVEDALSYYRPISDVWVARNSPRFAFVKFVNVWNAENTKDAIKEMDCTTVCGICFHSEDRCYKCDDKVHYARDGREHKGGNYSNRGKGFDLTTSLSHISFLVIDVRDPAIIIPDSRTNVPEIKGVEYSRFEFSYLFNLLCCNRIR